MAFPPRGPSYTPYELFWLQAAAELPQVPFHRVVQPLGDKTPVASFGFTPQWREHQVTVPRGAAANIDVPRLPAECLAVDATATVPSRRPPASRQSQAGSRYSPSLALATNQGAFPAVPLPASRVEPPWLAAPLYLDPGHATMSLPGPSTPHTAVQHAVPLPVTMQAGMYNGFLNPTHDPSLYPPDVPTDASTSTFVYYSSDLFGTGLSVAPTVDLEPNHDITFVSPFSHPFSQEPFVPEPPAVPAPVRSWGNHKAKGSSVSKAACQKRYGRTVTACVRCRYTKRSCKEDPSNPSGPCLECAGHSFTMSNLPCAFTILTQVVLFRSVNDAISNKKYDLQDPQLSSLDPIKDWRIVGESFFEMKQGGGVQSQPLRLQAYRYAPTMPQLQRIPDTLKPIFNHFYGLLDLPTAEHDIKRFIIRNIPAYIGAKVDKSDQISRIVFTMAYRLSEKTPLLFDTLFLWTAARFIEGEWALSGAERLDLPTTGDCPLVKAPIIDCQFASIVVQKFLLPVREKVLKQLQRLALERRPQNWLVIFLTSFILLNGYGLLIRQQNRFARSHHHPYRYSNMDLICDLFHGSSTILTYFHYLNKGQKPFDLKWETSVPKNMSRIAKLDENEVKFMDALSQRVRAQRDHFITLAQSDKYEATHWFTGQLFVPNWQPPDTIVRSPRA